MKNILLIFFVLFLIDIGTLYSIDSVPVAFDIPVSKYNYVDTLIQGQDSAFISEVVSGYCVKVDSLKLRLKITNTVATQTPVKQKEKRIMVGFQTGINLTKPKAEPYFGIGITYRIFSF